MYFCFVPATEEDNCMIFTAFDNFTTQDWLVRLDCSLDSTHYCTVTQNPLTHNPGTPISLYSQLPVDSGKTQGMPLMKKQCQTEDLEDLGRYLRQTIWTSFHPDIYLILHTRQLHNRRPEEQSSMQDKNTYSLAHYTLSLQGLVSREACMVIKGMCITESVCCTEGKGSVIMYEQLYKRCQQYNATLL